MIAKTTVRTRSAGETQRLGQRLGRRLVAGDLVLLSGELGTGKTTLARGLARGLGVRGRKKVTSPTFVLVHEYSGRVKVYHHDWYRLKQLRGADEELVEECLSQPAVSIIEWPERGKHLLPKKRYEIKLRHLGGDRRSITIRCIGKGRGQGKG